MSFYQELGSWFAPRGPSLSSSPMLASQAPSTDRLPTGHGKQTIVVFLRHCGCPFAEKTYLNIREVARAHKDINFTAVSHSDEASTNRWLQSLPQAGSEPANLSMIVDAELQLYAAWGLGPTSYGHVLSLSSLQEVWRLARDEGIANRPTESGSRWQTSGFWAIDADGITRWGRPAKSADDVPDFEQAVEALINQDAGVRSSHQTLFPRPSENSRTVARLLIRS
ncbi:AhpC/TSA family [Teratosphaeria destructans]|uniref:AhpC/TSA family n=1 Tax=Teratosphaeria destructans TaxID=418781 RepID=A0A9W7VYM3_9PEZI|nr:AhpC/TSA family [Teratosphaeria destructans]